MQKSRAYIQDNFVDEVQSIYSHQERNDVDIHFPSKLVCVPVVMCESNVGLISMLFKKVQCFIAGSRINRDLMGDAVLCHRV